MVLLTASIEIAAPPSVVREKVRLRGIFYLVPYTKPLSKSMINDS